MKSLKEGIEEHKLELIFYGNEIELFRELFKEAQEHYPLWCEEEDERPDYDSVIFRIYCSSTSFANAYYYIGTNVGIKIISKRKNGKQGKVKS